MLALIGAATSSVATVAMVASVGAYAAHREILTKSALKPLDKLVKEVFTPAMVFYKVVPNISVEILVSIWPMAAGCLVVVLSGLALGYTASHLLHKQHPSAFPRFQGLLMVALAFPNSFAIPMTLQLTLSDLQVFRQEDLPDADAVRDHTLSLYLFSYVVWICLLYTSDAADEEDSVALGGRRTLITKNNIC
eukprot:TRINITY_DN62873_c0_g1_i1.p2 TRINITY_DN62873_c0_g1~~TRINITY_DN62873_c0_g1_i1.p2  ORF type:complete len:192 (+),score=48.39 TRINITY_DN62873_c0_g1_i1:158-733(+)